MSFSNEKFLKTLQRDIGKTKPFTDMSSPKHAACYLLQTNILKKFSDGPSTERANLAAIDKFVKVNEGLLSWKTPETQSLDPLISKILIRARTLCANQFLDLDGFAKFRLGHAFNRGMVGPGASVEATGQDVMAKLFMSRLTCTDSILYTHYMGATRNNFRWEVADLVRGSKFGKFKVVEGSNLFTVPKETEIARVAFTEPTLNMWGQLGYGSCIQDLLKKYHDIDLSVQPKLNSWFAKSGSLNGEFGTIDLRSASDTIGSALCEWLLPPQMFKDLSLLRSKTARVPGIKRRLTLHMISTMGNGFTFPLQTWIFANLVLAAYLEMGIPTHDIYGKRRYGVFGDDIICESRTYDIVVQSLTACGFSVNDQKSFNTGKFRESCGTDFFNGVDVRAVYLKSCTSDAHVYSLINRLLIWSSKHKVSLPNVFEYLLGLVPYRPIPFSEEITAGIYTPIRFLTMRKSNYAGHWIYHPLRALTSKISHEFEIWDTYYHGAVIAALNGSIRNGSINSRTFGDIEFKVVKSSIATSWEYIIHKPLHQRSLYDLNPALKRQDLVSAYESNIGYPMLCK